MKPFSARVLLSAVFIARGTSFLFSKQLLTSLSPMSILAVRFLLAFLVLALIFNKKIRQLDHKSLKGGIILSNHIFTFLGIESGLGFARISHLLASHWYYLFVLHLQDLFCISGSFKTSKI